MNTLFTGQNIIKLDACASVNTYATELLKGVKVHEGTVVITDKQTAGRGQRGNHWHSEAGKNITMSIVYHPGFLMASEAFKLSMMVSLALHDLLTEVLTEQHEIRIKWPNDMYVDGRKIAGILIENVYREEQIQSSVIGIGLNVNQENFGELDARVHSLTRITGKEHDLKDVLAGICEAVEARYLQLRSMNNSIRIKDEYLERLYLWQTQHEFALSSGASFSGKITDVAEDGKLIVQQADGSAKRFDIKEIVF